MKLSEHVTIEEFIYSPTAVNRGIDNSMNIQQTDNAKKLCINVFEPIRSYVGEPIKINSGFRGIALNKVVKGAYTSQHCLGEAMDLDLHDRDLFEWIIDNIEYDQLIFEFGTTDSAGWFHISYREGRNRKQVLRATKVKGKTVYLPYEKH